MSPRLRVYALFGLLIITGAAFARAAFAAALSGEELVRRLKAAELSRLVEDDRTVAPAATEALTSPLRAVPFRAPGSIFPNVLVNDRSHDAPGAVQSSVSIAASGRNVVAVWNDGQGLITLGSMIGYASSNDDGATWKDGGAPLTTGGVTQWTSSPMVAVNEATGTFYLVALCQPTSITNGVAVTKGTFIDGEVMWDTPRIAASGNRQAVRYEAPWLAADPESGNLYLTYVRYSLLNGSNRIDYQRNTGNNAIAWSAPATLSSPDDVARVRAPRIAAGPEGTVWAAWHTIGTGPLDFIKVRRSTNSGLFFAQEATAESLYANFGSGAPGYNRGAGFVNPSLAVDRSFGPHRGRAYLAWNESVNFFDDPLGTGTAAIEEEPDDSPVTATPFAPGDILSGAIATASDVDCWSFHGVRDQTVIFYLTAGNGPNLDAGMRVLCSDGVTRLAFSESGVNGTGLIVWTPPADGTYTLRVESLSGYGAYTIFTGLNGKPAERARDHRDVFASGSDDGRSWGAPVRVNDDPAGLDDWMPEIMVGEFGRPYVMWYDWRDAPPATCGGVSSVYLSRSDDGGGTWTSLGPISNQPTAWTSVVSPYLSNQGSYLGACGNARGIHVAWADGRLGDPDVFATFLSLDDGLVGVPPATPAAPAILDVPNPSRAAIHVTFSLAEGSLAEGAPGTLTLIDIAGRRLSERAVTGTGRQTIDLASGALLAPGVYLVRLTQGGRSIVRRVSLLR